MKKKLFALTLCGTSFFWKADAQKLITGYEAQQVNSHASEIRYSDRSEYPAYLNLTSDARKRNAFINPADAIKSILSLDENSDLVAPKITKTNDGFTFFKYNQTYKGIPIWGSSYTAIKKNGTLISLSGDLFRINKSTSSRASISEEKALQNALDHFGAEKYIWEIESQNKLLREIHGNTNASFFPKGELTWFATNNEYSNFTLAYAFKITAADQTEGYEYLVDATSGKILNRFSTIHSVDEEITADGTWRKNLKITVNAQNGQYCLEETGRGNGIVTYDAKKAPVDLQDATVPPGSDNDICEVGSGGTAVFSTNNKAGVDAHYASEKTHDYLYDVHSRQGIDDRFMKIIGYVWVTFQPDPQRPPQPNAFWNGDYMVYCYDPQANNRPITALDVGGHEIGHGVTQTTSGLVYQAEPGALNESNSDIWGTLVEHHTYGTEWTDEGFQMGNEMGWVIRSIANPNQYNQPDTYRGNFWAPLNGPDNGGVHTNSGIQNFWFYLLTKGGTGTNDNNDAYDVTAIGWEDFEKLFYNYILRQTRQTQHSDARNLSVEAAKEVFGECSQQHKSVEDAWYAVGVGAKSNCIVVEQITAKFDADKKEICAGQEVQFTDMSEGEPTGWNWTFQNGTPSTSTEQNPKVIFNTPGKHTIQLTITKGAIDSEAEEKEFIVVTEPKLLPVSEGFEDAFPKEGWMVDNPDEQITWEKSTHTGIGSNACLMINNASYQNVGQKDALMLPEIDLTNATIDPVLTFFVAYTRFNNENKDKLRVYVSDDCGETWNSVYFKEMKDLETKEVPFDESQEWVPEKTDDWRWEIIDLADYKGKKSVKIKMESTNGYGNNIWLDNINIDFTSGKKTISGIENSLTIAPNPNKGEFNVKFNATQKANYTIKVTNVLGKVVYNQSLNQFNGLYNHSINLNGESKGIYFLSIESANNKASKKIMVQ